MIAFYAKSYTKNEMLSDPSKIRWYATNIIKIDGIETYPTYRLEPCSEEEFAKFYPPVNKQTEKTVKDL